MIRILDHKSILKLKPSLRNIKVSRPDLLSMKRELEVLVGVRCSFPCSAEILNILGKIQELSKLLFLTLSSSLSCSVLSSGKLEIITTQTCFLQVKIQTLILLRIGLAPLLWS